MAPPWRPHPTPSQTILEELREVARHLREHFDGKFCALDERLSRELAALGAQLHTIKTKQETIMSALDDLKAADAALQAEVATFLADIAAALSAEDPDIEQITSDINAQVAALQGGDPANPPSA